MFEEVLDAVRVPLQAEIKDVAAARALAEVMHRRDLVSRVEVSSFHDEAIPIWTPLDRIPYDEMWRDDGLWLPLALAGKRFDGRFVFDGDAMLWHEIDVS